MEVKILAEKRNSVLKRREVKFSVEQGSRTKTPARLEVKKTLAAELKTSDDLVFIKRIRTMSGTSIAIGVANAYESRDQAKRIEPQYIMKRNSPPEKTKEEAKE